MPGTRIGHRPHIACAVHVDLYSTLTFQGLIQHWIKARDIRAFMLHCKSRGAPEGHPRNQDDQRPQRHGNTSYYGLCRFSDTKITAEVRQDEA